LASNVKAIIPPAKDAAAVVPDNFKVHELCKCVVAIIRSLIDPPEKAVAIVGLHDSEYL